MFNPDLFGKTLRLKRIITKDSLRTVSEITGVHSSTLHRYERIKTEPTINNIMLVCHKYLKMPADIFVTDNPSSAADILSKQAIHTFAAMVKFLSPNDISTLSVIIKRYNNVNTLFTDINSQQTLTELNTPEEFND